MADRAGSPATVLGSTFAGKYRVVQLLRTGGLAHVYLAEMMTLRPGPIDEAGPDEARGLSPDERPGGLAPPRALAREGHAPRFALKVLRQELARDPAVVRRFERGALAASRVVHPNVVRHGALERLPEGLPFCTMELLIGLDLADTLAQARMLEPARAVHIAEGVAAGLAAAHAAGVVHLDVKPENVFLVHQADGREVVKLIDFGLASLPGETRGQRVDAATGTPEYMAPEQRRGVAADPTMDVFALGLVLREMLTGHAPSAGTAARNASAGDVPPRLGRVIDRALARDPSARFATMLDLRAALLAAMEESPLPPPARLAGIRG